MPPCDGIEKIDTLACTGSIAHLYTGTHRPWRARVQFIFCAERTMAGMAESPPGSLATQGGKPCHYYTTLGAPLIVYSSDRACPCHAEPVTTSVTLTVCGLLCKAFPSLSLADSVICPL